ncbi:unnamed protein product [Durusdinium trenchii]|uniref:Uncharacterized protein n=1 Tax=Durusdinium trenchii TaxID=1381693 RepID=A0ABP0SB88_9DINO
MAQALPAFRRLSEGFQRFQEAALSREQVQLQFQEVRPYFNRALHVPDLAQQRPGGLFTQDLDWAGAEAALRQKGVAILDGVLTEKALRLVHRWLSVSTVWFQSLQEGKMMKAQLRDGLHGEPGLRLVQELQELLPRLLGQQALLDLIAYRHGPRSQGLAPHCLDGFLAVMMWLGDTAGSSVTISDLRKTTDNHCSSLYVCGAMETTCKIDRPGRPENDDLVVPKTPRLQFKAEEEAELCRTLMVGTEFGEFLGFRTQFPSLVWDFSPFRPSAERPAEWRLEALRELMKIHQLDAYFVTSSAGSALVTAEKALLWTDSRYFLQAEKQLAGTEWVLILIFVRQNSCFEFKFLVI